MEMCWIPAPLKDHCGYLGLNPALLGPALTQPIPCLVSSADLQDFG